MKKIEKNFQSAPVVAYEQELQKNQLDKVSLSNPNAHSGLDGSAVYDMVGSLLTFGALKEQLRRDQGGICCYCGQKLEYKGHPYLAQFVVEHVKPKVLDRTLAGEYENLLLSCRPSDAEEALRAKVSKKEKDKFFHCDKSKGSLPITYSPLVASCETIFDYDEFGDVKLVDNNDSDAKEDLETLNLACQWLRDRRAAAIEGELYDDNNELLPDAELKARLATIMQEDAQGNLTEFCFAIKGAIEHILA